jgi:tape measure domain-containing protein
MSDNLTQVMLEFSANFDSFDSALKRAESRAIRAGRTIENALKVKGSVPMAGDRSVVTGRVPTASSINNNKTVVNVSRSNDPNIIKEGSATRSALGALEKSQKQAIQSIGNQISGTVKATASTNIFNQLKASLTSRTIDPVFNSVGKLTDSITESAFKGLQKQFETFADIVSVDLAASLKTVRDPLTATVSEAMMFGAKEGATRIADEIARAISESFGLFEAETLTLQRAQKSEVGGNKSVRSVIATGKDIEIVDQQIKDFGIIIGGLKRSLSAMEKSPELKDKLQQRSALIKDGVPAQEALIRAKLQKDLAQNEFNDLRKDASTVMTGDTSREEKLLFKKKYKDAEKLLAEETANVARLNQAETQRKQALFKIEQSAIVKKYDNKKTTLRDAESDRANAEARKQATVQLFDQSVVALDEASSNGLMKSRDELSKAYDQAKKELAALKLDESALESIDTGKTQIASLESKVARGEDKLAARKSKANTLKNAFYEEQDPDAKRAIEKKYKAANVGIAKIEKNLKTNRAELKKAEEAVTQQISALNSSGYVKLQAKTEMLSQELLLIHKVLSKRSSAKLPKLMQDILKELNVTVEDMDKLPNIEYISQAALDRKSNKKGSTGNYDSSTNTLSVLKSLKDEMDKGLGEVADDVTGILTHELTHSIQTNFGQIQVSDILSGTKAPKLLIKQASITKDELVAVAKVIKSYQEAGANANEIALEIDAFISQLRIQKKNRKLAISKKAPELIDAGKQGIIQLYAQVNKALPNLSDKVGAKVTLGKQFEDDAKAMLKKANEFKSGFATTGDLELGLNLDGVYNNLMAMVQELAEFKAKTEIALAEAEKESALIKKKESIKSRIGQGVKNKLTFQTAIIPYNGDNKGAQLVIAGSKAVGGALLEATKDVYQLAAGTEAAAMAMFPLLKGVKTITQVLGVAAVAASVPGSGMLLEGAHAVIAPAIDLAATGISGMVGGVVESAVLSASGAISGAIAESGAVGAATIAGALTSAGATIAASAGAAAGAAAGVGTAGVLTAGAVAIPTVAAVKGVNNGIDNVLGDTSKARANGERFAKNLGLLAGAVQENFLATKSQLKSLAPAKGANQAQLQASYSKQVFLLKGQIEQTEQALENAKGDKTATRLIKETRKKLLNLLKSRQNQATAAGVEIVDHRTPDSPMRKVRQVTVVDEAINAGKKGAKLAKDFSDGFSQTIDATTDFWDSAEAAANRSVKGFAKGQDSASPSKKMKRLAKDFRDGFVLSVSTDKNFFNAAKDAASYAIKGFNKPFLDEKGKPSRLLALKIEAAMSPVPPKLNTQNKRPQNSRDDYADYLKDYNALSGEVDAGRVVDTTNEEILAGQIAAKKGIRGLLDYAALGQIRATDGMRKVAKAAASTLADASVSITGGVSDTAMAELDNRILTATARVEQHLNELDKVERLISEQENYQAPTKPKNKYANRASRVVGATVGANSAGDAGEAVGETVGELKNQVTDLLAKLRISPGIGEFFTGINRGFNTTGKGALKFKAQLAAALTLTGFILLKNQILGVGKALFNTALEMEVVQKKMNSVNMGGQDPFKTFSPSANKAGLSVKDYASNFAGMVQTMSRSVPNADKVFESITEGLNKRGVVGDAMTRSMEALSQISSKGVVSMEELRQQLGEALPGAMTIAADSMGMTNGQFMKMVESGEMLSSDFLPKFGMALNNVAGGDLPSLNTELQTAKNNIDGILAQSASTIPFTGALQSFNAIVSQSSDFLKILVPVVGVALVGAFVAAAGVIISTVPIIGAAFTAALPAAAWVAGIALAMTAMVEFVKYLKGAGTEFDKIGEKMEKALNPKVANRSKLAATGTIARLNDSLTSFFTPGQSSKFAEKETIEVRGQASRQIQKQQDAINKAAKKLTPDNVLATEKQVSPLVIQKQKLQIKLSNADALGLSQDAKKNITKSINDLDAEIKNIVEKNLGSEIDVNTTLKATLESKAVLEADAKARGEDVAVLYGAQYQNLVKQEQVLKSMVAQFAAVAGFSNNQLKAQKEMNAILSLGTKVSEKEGVMETLAAYKELESLTTTMAGFDSASMEIDIAVKEGAVKEIESQISSIDAFVSTSMGTAQEQVINKAFKNGWKKATAREIADFKVQIESGALGEVDKAVVSMVESLEKKSELEKELGQTNIDLIKANRQLEQALLDLNDARLNQQMQGNQTEMSLIQLVADLQKMSPENSKEVFDASNSNTEFRLQQQESLRNLSVSFRSFGESLTDAADNLKSGIASMNDEIRSTAASLKTTALNGATAFANAAGIEDTLGLGRLLDLASEKINIKASDKTASIERQQASENKTDKRQIRDFTEQREGLNREADRASMEIVRAIENNNFDMKDLEVNFELSGMQLQDKLDAAVRDVTGLERSTNEFNDRALGFGQAPVDVDISGLKNRLSQIQTMVTEEVDSGAIVQALYDLKVQQNADAQEFLSGIQATKVQGNQGLTQKINDITAFNKEKNVAFETQKGMEKERVELELDINDEKFQGTLVDIKRKLKEAGLAAVRSAEGVGLAVNDKLATVGLAANPYELLRMESKRWKRDTLADIDAQQKALKNTVDMLGEGGNTADNKLNVQANLNNSNLDAETKDSLLSQLASVKTAQEFEAYIKSVKDSLASLETSEKQVLSNADEIEARSIKLAKAKDLLAKNNTLTGEKQSFLDSVDTSRLSSGEERELELAKKKLKIAQDTANKIAQIDEDAMMQPDLYGGDVQKNRTNIALEAQANLLRKAQKEASILNDIYANMSSAGVDAIKSAILGIGEAILSNKPKQEEQDKLDADYAERLSSLVDGYTGSAEELQYAKNQLDEQRDDIQDEIETKLSKTAQIFDVLKGALSGFAQSIAQVAAQMAATAAIKGIAGAFGGGWGSLASSLIGGANMGGHAGVDVISNYSMGGTAGVADALALQAGIGKAMRKEGQGAMPIVVHKGEQILSTRNGDAQLFRALKAQGEWDNIKQANVSNYANGGTAGYSGAAGGGSMVRRGMQSNSNTYYSSNVTVVANDIGSFKKNEQQLLRETEAAQTRSVRRGLG